MVTPTAASDLPRGLASRPEHFPESPLSVHAVTVAYHRKPVLWDVDFDTPPNTLTAIVGPNGAGKSTLIKSCLGLTPRASGEVEFWGMPLARARRRIGYVPQRESVDWDFPDAHTYQAETETAFFAHRESNTAVVIINHTGKL